MRYRRNIPDGTAWVALYAQNMLEMAVELAAHESAYDDLATNFLTQFILIGRAVNAIGPGGMWDEEDGFYYDILRFPDGRRPPGRSTDHGLVLPFLG